MKPQTLDLSRQSSKTKIPTHQESEAEFPSLEEYIASLREYARNKKILSHAFTNVDQLATFAKLISQQILKLRSDGKQIDGILSLGSQSSKSPNTEFPVGDCLERLTYYYTIQDDPENSFKVVNIGLEADGYESRSEERFKYIQKIQLIPVDSESPDFQEEVDKILPKNCKNIILMLNYPESFVVSLTEEYIKRGGKYIVGTVANELYESAHCDVEFYKESPNFSLLKGKKKEDKSEFQCNDKIELAEYLKRSDEEYYAYYNLFPKSLSTSIPIAPSANGFKCFILTGEFDHKLFLESWRKNTTALDRKHIQLPISDASGSATSHLHVATINPDSDYIKFLFGSKDLNDIFSRISKRAAPTNTNTPTNTRGEGGNNYQFQSLQDLFDNIQQMQPQGGNALTQTHHGEAKQGDIHQEGHGGDFSPSKRRGVLEQTPSQRPQSPKSFGSTISESKFFQSPRK